MQRRRFLVSPLLALPLLHANRAALSATYPQVVPGYVLRFPDDEGSHPAFRIEWWYITGWLDEAGSDPAGFQVTFFRTRPVDTGGNPSRFAPDPIFIAHAAISDSRRGRVLHEQKILRGAFDLARATERTMDVALGHWS